MNFFEKNPGCYPVKLNCKEAGVDYILKQELFLSLFIVIELRKRLGLFCMVPFVLQARTNLFTKRSRGAQSRQTTFS